MENGRGLIVPKILLCSFFFGGHDGRRVLERGVGRCMIHECTFLAAKLEDHFFTGSPQNCSHTFVCWFFVMANEVLGPGIESTKLQL